MSVEEVLAELHTAVAAVGGKFEEEGEPIEGALRRWLCGFECCPRLCSR